MRSLLLTAGLLLPGVALANTTGDAFSLTPQIKAAESTLVTQPQEVQPLHLQDRAREVDRYLAAETWELLISGSGSSDNDFDAGGFGVNVQVGYFILDGLELALRQGITFADSGSESSWAGTTRVAVDYHFNLDRWQPFIGAQIGYVYGEDVHDTWQAGPEAGVKYFIKEEAFIYGLVEYQFFFDDAGDADSAFDDGQFVYTLGVGFTF